MDNLDEFKQFIQTIPGIKEDVLNHKYTWQQVYEIYTMYGKDDSFFDSYRKNHESRQVVDLLKNIDLDALQASLQSIEKILNIFSSLLVKSDDA